MIHSEVLNTPSGESVNGQIEPTDHLWIRRALDLAERGWGRVHPNPLVGAIVVADEGVVGSGYHAEYGGAHAEVIALADAGERAKGATLFVTLEPCSHHGKTPPCTEAIIEAGIERVVIAADDPNPIALGGAEILRANGLDVVIGVEAEAAHSQNAIFFHQIEAERPYLALKYGLTLDARISISPDRPEAITGSTAHTEVHRLRAGFDAIMVGSQTAIADDPLLTVRGKLQPRVIPARIVLDTDARLPLDSRLLETVSEAPLLIVSADDVPSTRLRALTDRGARVITLPRTGSGLPLETLLDRLPGEGINSIFCEGGGRLGAALIRAELVERLYLFYAPRILGDSAVPAFPGDLSGVPGRWRRRSLRSFDEDFLVILDRES